MTLNEANELMVHLTEQEPTYVCRVLPDNTVACTFELIYTRAIILDVSENSFERRFCFDDRELAMKKFFELNSKDDEPEGYIAKR